MSKLWPRAINDSLTITQPINDKAELGLETKQPCRFQGLENMWRGSSATRAQGGVADLPFSRETESKSTR